MNHLNKIYSTKYLLLEVFQLLCAAFFAIIMIVLYISFGGEFVLIYENIWVFIIFGGIIFGSAVYSIGIIILSNKSKHSRGLKLKITEKAGWLLGWALWNIFIGIILIILFFVVYILIADVLSGILYLLATILGIILIGYGCLLIGNSINVLRIKIRKKQNYPLFKGVVGVGFAFLFLLSSFLIIIALYNPYWSDGVKQEALFVDGEEKGRGYRIPAMLALPNNTILAFCESRAEPMLDWGDIDLVMKRSTDGGKSWSKIKTLRDEGSHTAGNPCPVFDNDTKMVWLPFCIDNKEVYVMNSSDYGKTWSKPREITEEIGIKLSGSKDPLDMEYGTGPGCGIQLSTGRLIIPSYYFDERGSHVLYSDDHGLTWEKGENLKYGGECQAFETAGGLVSLNCRTRDGYRYIAFSDDGGETWDEGETFDYELPEPEAGCMASIIRFTKKPDYSKNRVLFSNPGLNSRGHLTIKMSTDEGESWDISKEVYSGPSAYSQMVILSDLTICVLFECGKYDYRESIVFAKVDLDWLTEEEEPLDIIFLFIGLIISIIIIMGLYFYIGYRKFKD